MTTSSATIRDITEEYLTENRDFASCKIFRVENHGSEAYVGVRARNLIDFEYLVLKLDLDRRTVVSEDVFESIIGFDGGAKRRAQEKIDQIEGVDVDRSSTGFLDSINDDVLERLLYGKNPGYGSGPHNAAKPLGSSLGNEMISFAKKTGDVFKGDWFGSPECPECGSQKVGKENENAYQCRDCGEVFRTGLDLDISFSE